MRLMRAGFLVCILWCCAAGALAQARVEPAQQVDPAARLALELGLDAYEHGQFAQALAAFERAYSISPHPKLLFNIARAADGDARFARAISAYEAYLAEDTSANNREFVEARIDKLKKQQATSLRLESATVEAGPRMRADEDAALPPAARRDDDERATPLWKRGWVWGVVGCAVAAGVTTALIVATREEGSPSPRVDESYMTLWRL